MSDQELDLELEPKNNWDDYDHYPNHRLARAYIPFQSYKEHYEPQIALQKGTAFPELYQPYQRKKY
ncbi:MAG: spore coat associated protein CotJA [Bacillota bacterium]